jgi:hypothetical protein
VPFKRLEDDLLDLDVRHAEEALRGRLQRRLIAADLDVRDRLDRHRYTFERVRPLDFQRDRHHVEVQVLDLLEKREPQSGAAADHAVANLPAVGQLAFASAENGDGVG